MLGTKHNDSANKISMETILLLIFITEGNFENQI